LEIAMSLLPQGFQAPTTRTVLIGAALFAAIVAAATLLSRLL
jgi:hypothetical protein